MKLSEILVIKDMGLLSEFFYPSSKNNCFINNCGIKAKILSKPSEHKMGFMFQDCPKEDEGLLFLYPNPVEHGFWMKNVDFDLELLIFNNDRKLIEIINLLSNDETIKTPSNQYSYALEVPKGFCNNNNIKLGDLLTFKL